MGDDYWAKLGSITLLFDDDTSSDTVREVLGPLGNGRYLAITTADGSLHEGYCTSWGLDEVTLSDTKLVPPARIGDWQPVDYNTTTIPVSEVREVHIIGRD